MCVSIHIEIEYTQYFIKLLLLNTLFLSHSPSQAGFDVVFIYHRFYLKATRCPKGTEDPAGCSFRNDVVSGTPKTKTKKVQRDNLAELFSPVSFQPMIDCAICYKTFQGDIEAEPKPYLNCLRKPSVTPVGHLVDYPLPV